jgi:hypothetical protein
MSLVAKDGEEKVELLHSYSAYETRKPHMSREKKGKFQYPCVYVVNSKGVPQLWYSSIRNNDHFGKIKIVISNGRISSANYFIDNKGEYGLTQFSFGIIDSLKNLKMIYKAMRTDDFKSMMECCATSLLQIDKDIIATFRKDFWKEFI